MTGEGDGQTNGEMGKLRRQEPTGRGGTGRQTDGLEGAAEEGEAQKRGGGSGEGGEGEELAAVQGKVAEAMARADVPSMSSCMCRTTAREPDA